MFDTYMDIKCKQIACLYFGLCGQNFEHQIQREQKQKVIVFTSINPAKSLLTLPYFSAMSCFFLQLSALLTLS